jgi:hypothetical protein
MAPGQRVYGCHAKEESGLTTLKNGDLSAEEENLTEKHRSSRTAGGWRRVDSATCKNDMLRNPKKTRPTQGCRVDDDESSQSKGK